MTVRSTLATSLLLPSFLLLAGCGGGDDAAGSPSGATCPTGGTTLRYTGGGNGGAEPSDFGKTFFDGYCIACHSPDGGAVANQDFSTYAGIVPKLARIDARAAAGPAATNTSMPALPPAPSLTQRQLLGTWIACGAREN
jgi:hypothetical protein